VPKKKRRTRPTPRPQAPNQPGPGSAPARTQQDRDEARRLRRDEARRQRELIRRKMARRRYYQRGLWVLAGLVAAGGIYFLATRPKGAALSPQQQALLAQAPRAAKEAGCTGVKKVEAYPDGSDQGHIGATVANAPPLSSYPSKPPASGPHAGSPVGAGVYSDPVSVYGTIHSLEHGAAIVWYSPSAPKADVAKVTDFFLDPNVRDHVIVSPYDFPDQGAAGSLPQGMQMALVSWHHVEFCRDVSLPVAFDFVSRYRYPTPKGESYKGDAPEAGAPI
jgi:hypothetical protein